jgi:hypothetical protein
MAHAQFQAVGDRLTVWPVAPKMPIERLQKARDHTATIMARNGGRGGPVRKGAGAGNP